jgi:putative phosphoribosyl transferase
MQRFQDRSDAGRQLARKLSKYGNYPGALVLALPRGGVPVAFEVARAIKAPLDVLIVRKLGLPGQEELALGAIASGGIRILNEDIIEALGVSRSIIDQVTERELAELERREKQYRGNRPAPEIRDRTVILIDDGLATGASMRIAVRSLKDHGPVRIIVAVPVAPAETCTALAREADEVVCSLTPAPFYSIGAWYEDFAQTSDNEVIELLEKARASRRAAAQNEPGREKER